MSTPVSTAPPAAFGGSSISSPTLSMRKVIQTWWPLAAGWLVMTIEIPLLAAFVARAADPKVHLAAWGMLFPIVLILASPVMMLLAASTTLCKDWQAFTTVRRYMYIIAAGLTALHALLAFTPLFELVVVDFIAPPAEIVEPVRMGLRAMLPWSFCLGFRRFNYGILIRAGHTQVVTMGAVTRVCGTLLMALLLFMLDGIPGALIAAGGIVFGVITEAVYAGIQTRPVLRNELRHAPRLAEPLTLPIFRAFYLPLVMTSLLQIAVQPVVTAALSRMPQPLDSLATWPVLYGLIIIFMSVSMASIEAIVVLLDEPGAPATLRRFMTRLAITMCSLLIVLNATPLAELWFTNISALPTALVHPAHMALWLALPIPALAAFEALFQGTLMHRRRTRGITEAVLLGLTLIGCVLMAGVLWGEIPGIYVGMGALSLAYVGRAGWLWQRSSRISAK
ncbi:MAG: hypothetical protein KDE46_24945 [Caldilineaceae bacterium]|nr:hypothetical protein [Caldilineaceae bacterium]